MITKEFKLTKKSQVTIPESVKETLGIKAGDAVVFDVYKDAVRILAFSKRSVDIMSLPRKYRTTPKRPVSVEDMNEAIRSGWRKAGLDQ